MQNWLSQGVLKLAVKNCILKKMILKFMNLIFGISEEKINFETFYGQNYSQKVCSRSTLNHPIRFWGLFYTKKAPSHTLTYFYGYNAFWCIHILLTLKNKKKFCSPAVIFWGDMFSNVFLSMNSVFLLSYKISFADLRSLFMEHITNTYYAAMATSCF